MKSKTTAATVIALNMAITGALLTATNIAAAQSTTPSVTAGVTVPSSGRMFLLTTDNTLFSLRPDGVNGFTRVGKIVPDDGGNVIGIDFRPAERNALKLWALTDKGNIYTLFPMTVINDVINGSNGRTATMSPRFTGGVQGVFDFNPVANALRVMGSNDQNLAAVNGADGKQLSTTVVQTTYTYVQGDVNFGKDPEISGGSYTNAFVNATTTEFFLIDHDKDTLVTIADKTAAGSSNTAGGKLKTIGNLVLANGSPFNAAAITDFDIYTDNNGVNMLLGISGNRLFSIDLAQVNANLPAGKTQNVVVRVGNAPASPGATSPVTGGFIDIAMPVRIQ